MRFIFLIFFALLSLSLFARQDRDSLFLPPADSSNLGQTKPVIPWTRHTTTFAKNVTSDSLLRWQHWPNWGDWYARKEDAFSFRQGTIGRTDAFIIDGFEPRYQTIEWEGLAFNDPVTGLINHSEIPHNKLHSVSESKGIGYTNRIHLQNYYITKPVTYLIFDESKFRFQNLEFMYSKSFSKKTNIELTVWDRRDGDAFERSDVDGTQFFGKMTHHFSNKWMLQTLFLRNDWEREESFGYVVGNPETFNFSRFDTDARRAFAFSNQLSRTWSLSLHGRETPEAQETRMLGIQFRKYEYELTDIADTLRYDIDWLGFRARAAEEVLGINFEGNIQSDLYSASGNSSLSIDDWAEWNASASANTVLLKTIKMGGGLNLKTRDDKNAGSFQWNVESVFSENLSIRLDVAAGEWLPTVHQLYLQSNAFTSNSGLKNETVQSAGVEVSLKVLRNVLLGAKGRLRVIDNGIHLNPADSSFQNSGEYTVSSGTVYGALDAPFWEFSLAATVNDYTSGSNEEIANRIGNLQPKVLFRSTAHVKGYVYNKAAFLKAGFAATFSPNRFEPLQFLPNAGNWNLISDEALNPAYTRLDFDFTARVRTILVLLRWENILDGFGQTGYFEAGGFPMPPRRLTFGIKAIFRN